MRASRLVIMTAATAVAAVLTLGSTPVAAQPADLPPVTVAPAHAPPGTVITISGEGCTGSGVVIRGEYVGDSGERSFTMPWGSDADGSWSATYRIREDDPLGTYTLRTTCYISDGNANPPTLTPVFDYADATFEVTDWTAPPLPTVLPVSVDPTSGPIGTTVSVSGTDCAGDTVDFALLAGTGLEDITAVVDSWSTEPAEDGTWSGELLVYDTMALPTDELVDVVPGGDYFVAAACAFYPSDAPDAPSPDHLIFSEPVDFDITGDGTAPRADPPPPTAITDIQTQAQPATPVVADPDYTG